MKHRKFDYHTIEEFEKDREKLKQGFPITLQTDILKEEWMINKRQVKNRLVAQPVEGLDSELDGSPSQRALERYIELADGGVGTIWMESISVSEEGKSGCHQMHLTEANLDSFRQLVQKIHEHGNPYVVAQLTHSGRYSNPDGQHQAVCAFENPMIPKENYRVITDDELEQLREDYIKTAQLAEKAGYDAVDIRVCHGYLLNELLAAYDREGRYGGSYENRIRLLKEIIQGVRESTDITVAVRLNLTDGLPYPYGWGCAKTDVYVSDYEEPLRLVRELAELGVKIFNISTGIGACVPHMIRPFDSGGPVPDEHPLEGVERLLQAARAVKQTVPDCVVVGSGFTWLRSYAPLAAAGGIKENWFDLAGFGRQWVRCPSFADHILKGETDYEYCVTCGGCSALIKKAGQQMRCVRKGKI